MAPSDDLKTHAASSHDFYELLEISPAAADSEIRRGYRKAALKYHPDKLKNTTSVDLDKFHLLQIAYDVLSEPSVRQLYDNAREARERKKRETEMLQGARRKMKEDLEARERGVKRPWAPAGPGGNDVENVEDKLEQEIRRLAEDGKRRRRAKEELMRREVLEEEERRELEKEKEEKDKQTQKDKSARKYMGGTAVPEIDRTVKVRWVRDGIGLDLDKSRLETLFSMFGGVESAFTLKDKRQRVEGKREKKTFATGVVVFSSIVGAHAAVEDRIKQHGDEWDIIESVFWASNKEPPGLETGKQSPPSPGQRVNSSTPASASTSTPEISTPASTTTPKKFTFPGLNTPASAVDGDEKKSTKAPSFTSFSSAGNTPGESKRPNLGPNSPNLEEITLIRLKNAERKRLEEQIQKEDEAASLAEFGTTT